MPLRAANPSSVGEVTGGDLLTTRIAVEHLGVVEREDDGDRDAEVSPPLDHHRRHRFRSSRGLVVVVGDRTEIERGLHEGNRAPSAVDPVVSGIGIAGHADREPLTVLLEGEHPDLGSCIRLPDSSRDPQSMQNPSPGPPFSFLKLNRKDAVKVVSSRWIGAIFRFPRFGKPSATSLRRGFQRRRRTALPNSSPSGVREKVS